MASRDVALGIILLFQTTLGILGNSVCLCCLILADFTGIRARPTDLIVKHLTWANLMVLLCKGIPQAMAALGHVYFLDEIACKLVFYLHRVARGVCLGSTALLSVFQAIMIHPSNSKSMQLKVRASNSIVHTLVLCWTLSLLVNVFIPMNMTHIWGVRNLTSMKNYVYCASVEFHSVTTVLFVVLSTTSDVLCLGLMTWASGSMVLLLLEHKQSVRRLHRSGSSRSSPETRATQSILILVSSFLLFYLTSAILMMYLTFLDEAVPWLVHVSILMTACFPAFCPFVLIRHCHAVSSLSCSCSC